MNAWELHGRYEIEEKSLKIPNITNSSTKDT